MPRTRALLSTLWIYVLLNMLLRDVHEVLRPGFVAELANSGTVHGVEVTDSTLLISGIILQLPLAMVVLARVLPRRPNRAANLAVALAVTVGLLVTWPKDPDDIVFGTFQLTALVLIAVMTVRWRKEHPNSTFSRP